MRFHLSISALPAALALLAFSVTGANALAADTHAAAYAPLWLYNGSWQVTRANLAPGAKPDQLQNQCALMGQFFICHQTVNGTPGNLLIVIASDKPGHYHTQTVMPEGRATGQDDLEIEGSHWTYSSRRSDAGVATYYRTTNDFTGKNKIHFEQAESHDGTHWEVKNSGDEVRVTGKARR